MRLIAWARKHLLATVVILVGAWLVYRSLTGGSLTGPGHASPEDAIAAGWTVWPRALEGWLEVSPDGQTSIEHDTGWTGDPFAKR